MSKADEKFKRNNIIKVEMDFNNADHGDATQPDKICR